MKKKNADKYKKKKRKNEIKKGKEKKKKRAQLKKKCNTKISLLMWFEPMTKSFVLLVANHFTLTSHVHV